METGIPNQETNETKTKQNESARNAVLNDYWRKNIRIMSILLGVWAFVSLGCGILFADLLNAIRIPGLGYPLGFWFAHQGAIIVFVVIIFAYCLYMNYLDESHHRDLEVIDNDDEVQS